MLIFSACEPNQPEKSTAGQESPEENLVFEGSPCGERGNNVMYKVYANGYDLTVVVYGQGAMKSYSSCPLRSLEDKDYKIVAARVEEGITYLGSRFFSGLEHLTKVSLPSSIVMYEDFAFCGCAIDTIVIPSGEIGVGAFSNCKNLKYCSLGDGVKKIQRESFCYCTSLENVVIGKSVTAIGERAFQACAIKNITFGKSVTNIGSSAFWQCTNLNTIIFSENVVSLDNMAFSGCTNLQRIYLNHSTISIGNSAFTGCSNLIEVLDGENVTRIGDWAFEECTNLKKCNLGTNVTYIGARAFFNCSNLEEILICDEVTSLGQSAFAGCKRLIDMKLGNAITEIFERVFEGCENLRSVTMGNSIWSIDKYAFLSCNNLTTIICPTSTPPLLTYESFVGMDLSGITVYVPAESVEQYKNNYYWKNFNIQPISSNQ